VDDRAHPQGEIVGPPKKDTQTITRSMSRIASSLRLGHDGESFKGNL